MPSYDDSSEDGYFHEELSTYDESDEYNFDSSKPAKSKSDNSTENGLEPLNFDYTPKIFQIECKGSSCGRECNDFDPFIIEVQVPGNTLYEMLETMFDFGLHRSFGDLRMETKLI